MKKILPIVLLLLVSIGFHGQNFNFALISDTHIKQNDSLSVNDLKRVVQDINETSDVSFVIVSGDISESGDKESLQKAKEILDKLNCNYYIVSGNHETKWSESGATDFAKVFGSERFEFDYQGVKLIGFNTGPIVRMMDGHVAPQDIKWINDILNKDTKQPVVVVTHYPLTSADVDNWYEVTDTLRKFNVRAILGGHYHSSRLTKYDDIPAFINRSSLRDKSDGVGGYTLYSVTSDSIVADVQKIGQAPQRLGGYSLKETYFSQDNTSYPRPDFSVNTEYSQVKEVWKINIGTAIYASPYVFGNSVFVGDDTGAMTCFDVKNGNKKWSFQSENRILGTPAVEKEILVFGSADNNIYALNIYTGQLLWKYAANAPVLGAVTVSEGVAYIGASDKTFRALDIASGKLKWEYNQVQGYIETRPLIYNDKVIFGAWDETMYALDKNTGRECWKWSDGRKGMHFSPAAVWPVAANGKIFFTAPDRVLSAVDAKTGKTVWRTSESMVRETIAISEDGKRLYSKTMQDSMVCYSATSKEPKRLWVTNVGYGYDHAASMPVEKDKILFGSTKNGVIFALNAKSGELMWKYKIGNSLIGSLCPLNANECIYTSADGSVGLLRYKK